MEWLSPPIAVFVLIIISRVDAGCILVTEVVHELTGAECPVQCKCNKNDTDCSDRNLTTVPDRLPGNKVKLNLHYNKLTHISDTDFAGCYSLQIIDLTKNQIRTIDSNSFIDCRQLRTLSLSSNLIKFSYLPKNVFRGLGDLTKLQLSFNNWTGESVYSGDLLMDMPGLQELSMDGIPNADFPHEFSQLKKLVKLIISGGINVVRNSTFAAFIESKITSLVLRSCKYLETLSPLSFAHFRHLSELGLNDNDKLGLIHASISFYGLQFTKLKRLSLSKVEPKGGDNVILTSTFFKYLNMTKLVSFAIAENNIVKIEPPWHHYLPELITLHLPNNRLSNIADTITGCSGLKVLQKLEISRQSCPYWPEEAHSDKMSNVDTEVDDLLDYGKPAPDEPMSCFMFNLQPCTSLSADAWTENVLPSRSRLKPVCISMSPYLRQLYLSDSLNVEKQSLPPLVISGGVNLRYIGLDRNGLKAINGPIIFVDPVTALEVDLSNNQISCIAKDLFKLSSLNGSKIVRLLLHANRLNTQLSRDSKGELFQYFGHLNILNLDKNGLKTLPRNVFIKVPQLQELYLSSNSLRQVEFEFAHMTKLTVLDLSFNFITTLSVNITNKLISSFERSGLKVNLNGNPFHCSCDTLPFMRWANNYRKHIKDFDITTCAYADDYITFPKFGKYVISDLEYACSKWIAVVVSGVLTAIALCLLTMSICCYRHRWEIRYACLKLTQRGQRYQELIDLPVEYEYDAFVVYDSEDRQWVNEELMPHLEQSESRGHQIELARLCVHERDFPPGQEIIGNIWNKMEHSRKVILVISKNFTGSRYCDYEMNLARMKSVENGRNVLVPVLLEMPDVDRVSDTLNWVLRKLTYIEWPQHEGEQEDFWQNLRDALYK